APRRPRWDARVPRGGLSKDPEKRERQLANPRAGREKAAANLRRQSRSSRVRSGSYEEEEPDAQAGDGGGSSKKPRSSKPRSSSRKPRQSRSSGGRAPRQTEREPRQPRQRKRGFLQ